MTQLIFEYDRVNRVWKFVIEERLSDSEVRAVLDSLDQHFFVYHTWQKENTEPTVNVFYVHCYIISLTSMLSRRYAKRIATALGRSEFLLVTWDMGDDPCEQIYSRLGASGRFRKAPESVHSSRAAEA